MKSKTITTIVIEGTDGVGKDTVAHEMWQRHDTHYRVYVRGEISDYVYSKKYRRPFISTQRGLPFIYIILTAKTDVIEERIRNRGDLIDLEKITDQTLFLKAYQELKQDYHILCVDTSTKDPKTLADDIYNLVDFYAKHIAIDESLNDYNKMYWLGCQKIGALFYVRNNQPYINDETIMADAQLHNGSYETFSDKTMPHNLIFSLAYNDVQENTGEFDFCYIIGSKIGVRQEVNDYFKAIEANNLTCIKRDTFKDKVFGDDYIKRIAKAKATIYCCRDLAYLKMITVRPYEAALAQQILFVDKLSDPDNEILRQIHGDTSYYSKLLYITPETLYSAYRELNENDIAQIRSAQLKWYMNLREELLHDRQDLCRHEL